MVNQQLVSYIQSQAQNGYSVDQIGNYLVGQGYKTKDVKSAIKSLTKIPVDKKTLIQRIVIGVMIVLVGYMAYSNFILH